MAVRTKRSKKTGSEPVEAKHTKAIEPIKLSFVIPCYNEGKRIQPLITALQDFVQKWKSKYEIIIVDDGSTDNVVEIIENNKFFQEQKQEGNFIHLLLKENKGKGNALKVGIMAASGTHIVTMDADLSYHPNEILKWLEQKGKQFNDDEILIGSRLKEGSEVIWEKGHDISNSKLRMVMGFIYNFYTQIMTTLKVRDNQSGFKLYPAHVAKYLFRQLKSKGWAHDVELLYIADLNGITITEMTVKCINREGSKINVIKDSFKMFFETFLIGLRVRWKYYVSDPAKVWLGKRDHVIPPVQNEQYFKREAKFRLIFVVLALSLLFLMPYLSKDYGIAGDEWIQNQYGLEIWDYFFHGSTDAYSATGRPQGYDHIIYYSGGIEFLNAFFIKLFPSINQYDIRHFINALFGFLLILFTGLLAKRIGGWRAGVIALVFLALSPRIFGHSMNNSKDIPFAFAVVFTLYHMIPLLRNMPRPPLKSILLVILGIAIAINVRVGGWLLFGYLGLFMGVIYILKAYRKEIRIGINKDFWQFAKITGVIIVVSYFLGLLFWPYAHLDLLSNPYSAFQEMSAFSIHVRILFSGGTIFSDEVPWDYTLTWLTRTSPEIILIYAALFIVLCWGVYKYYRNIFIWFLVFCTIFPVAYAVYQESPLYDGWRHFLFVYPTLVILAALTMDYLLVKTPPLAGKYAIAGLTVVGLIFPLRFMVANHPHQYVYFNDISGGLEAAYGNFETDYYMNSIKENFYEAAEKENWYSLEDSIQIASNTVKEVAEYKQEVSGKIKSRYTRYSNRSQIDWDYGVFFSRYVDQSLLKGGYWPPQNAVSVTYADGVPLSVTVKRPSKDDLLGYEALQQNNLETAISHFQKYIQLDTTNEMVYMWLGLAQMNTGQFAQSVQNLERAYEMAPNDNILTNLALAYIQAKQQQKGINILQQQALRMQQEEQNATTALRQDPQNQQAMQQLYQAYQGLQQTHQYLSVAFAQTGNMESANYHNSQSQIYQQRLQQFR